MKKELRRFTGLTAVGASLLQFVGCTPGLNEDVETFLRDFAREALAAFLL